MLRPIVILLLVANLVYFGWTLVSPAPGAQEAEPERVKRQVRPELLQVRKE